MNISQIVSSQANLSELPPISPGTTHHAKIIQSTGLDLNLFKEHEKMILIAGRLYRFENPKNYSLPNDVMAKIIPSSDGKLQLSITRATDIPQTITIQTDANPPKEFWNLALSPLDIKTPLDIKKLINDLGIDIWSLLLKGVARDKKHISGDMTELLEGWIIKSKEKSTDDFNARYFQLPILLVDKYEFAEITYFKNKMGKNTHKLVLKVGENEDEAVCSILLSNDNLYINFFSENRISEPQQKTLYENLIASFPSAEINFYKKKFISAPYPKSANHLNEYG